MNKRTSRSCAAVLGLALLGCGPRPAPIPSGPPVSLEQFAAEVEQATGYVLVDFWAPWCPPCRKLKPIFEKIEPDYAGRIRFFAVDVDQGPDVAGKYNIQSIPTLLLFKNGKPFQPRVGGASESSLRAWLDEQLKAGESAAP